MRNIHVLPTDNASRLYLHSENELQLRTNIIRTSEDYLGSNQNLYITSEGEIKEGDWCYDKVLNFVFKTDNQTDFKYANQTDYVLKIILTTDTDLIADGVQALEDEFLQWFVQNPSCEKVEVQKWSSLAECGYSYHIIIPKEEPKKIYYNTVGRENGVNVVKGQFNTQKEALDLANELNRKFPDLYYDWRETLIKEEPKQEYEYIGDCKGNNGNGCFMDSCGHDCGCYVRIPKPTDEKRRLMTELNKSKLYLILSVMVGFTLVNIIKDNNWVGYLLSLVVFPLITWGLIELLFKYKSK